MSGLQSAIRAVAVLNDFPAQILERLPGDLGVAEALELFKDLTTLFSRLGLNRDVYMELAGRLAEIPGCEEIGHKTLQNLTKRADTFHLVLPKLRFGPPGIPGQKGQEVNLNLGIFYPEGKLALFGCLLFPVFLLYISFRCIAVLCR